LPALNADELRALIGSEIGTSPWILLDQQRISGFAVLTEDEQFIHTDPEMAATTPFGGTIAHGFLLLSMLSRMSYDTLPAIAGASMSVNYGFDRVRFLSPVRAGSSVRGRFTLSDVQAKGERDVMLRVAVAIEIDGAAKPAVVADWLILFILGAGQPS
jgi:acyl dehydratase